MSSKQRVFSHQSNINYNDYLKNKNGFQLIKNLQSKNISKEIKRFINYEEFLILSKAYFKYRFNTDCTKDTLKDIYNSNTSLLVYDKIFFHISMCHSCSKNKNILDCFSCSTLNTILYPYGEYVNTNNENKFYFPSKLNLDEYCIQIKNKNICNEIIYFNDIDIHQNDNKIKKEQCKGTKPLFI